MARMWASGSHRSSDCLRRRGSCAIIDLPASWCSTPEYSWSSEALLARRSAACCKGRAAARLLQVAVLAHAQRQREPEAARVLPQDRREPRARESNLVEHEPRRGHRGEAGAQTNFNVGPVR